jgi:hypothetical protein
VYAYFSENMVGDGTDGEEGPELGVPLNQIRLEREVNEVGKHFRKSVGRHAITEALHSGGVKAKVRTKRST